jgi:peptidyl-prolyl cis-trans isomerase A (cyclophilin A)
MEMLKRITLCLTGALVLAAAVCSSSEWLVAQDGAAPFYVKLETSKGDVYMEVHSDWAPLGAARFKELVEAKYYDDCRFFRVLDGFMAQTGIHGDPATAAKWKSQNLKDDPVKRNNRRGFVSYAMAGPGTRTTQIFFNYADNSQSLDGRGFAPFAIVVAGMPVLDSLYSEYGEGAPKGRGPDQAEIARGGNDYLNKNFPKLDYIKTARIVDKSQVPMPK